MTRKILINALDPDENRIATIKDNKLEQNKSHRAISIRQLSQA